jgi:hypothetical protein
MSLVGSTQQEINNNNYNNDEKSLIKICKHICEKKKRQCKFNAIRNCDYCVEHLAFNEQVSDSHSVLFFFLYLFISSTIKRTYIFTRRIKAIITI